MSEVELVQKALACTKEECTRIACTCAPGRGGRTLDSGCPCESADDDKRTAGNFQGSPTYLTRLRRCKKRERDQDDREARDTDRHDTERKEEPFLSFFFVVARSPN